MRIVSYSASFVVLIVAGLVSLSANAAPIFVNADTTVSANATGDVGTTGAPDTDGTDAGAAVIWINSGVDVAFLTGYTFSGGTGGLGGIDAANDGGNTGGLGGQGWLMPESAGTATATGIFVYGGAGGDGRAGGTGGANDTFGGYGANGGSGIHATHDGIQIALVNTIVTGGAGGNGAAAGDAAGDASDNLGGGDGGNGGSGIYTQGLGSAIILTGSTVSGGVGGTGGTSLVGAINAQGGNGGTGITDAGTNTIITLGIGTIVQGGAAGTDGTGGTSGFSSDAGRGVVLTGVGASLTNHGTILGSGTGSTAAVIVIGDTTLIDNYGTIGAASGHSGGGLSIGSATVSSLHNRTGALIQSTGNEDTILLGPGALSSFINEGSILNSGTATSLRINGSIGTFVNSGTIQADSSTAILFADGDMPNIIDNTGGVISNAGATQGAITIIHDLGATGITFEGGQISNTGGFAAIRVFSGQTGGIEIKNAIVNGGVLFQSADETLNLTGATLNGDVEFAAGNNNVNFFGGTTTLSADTQFQNTTYFSVLEGAYVTSNAIQSDANSSIGQLTTILNSTLTLNEDFWADDQVLNQGTIAIAAGKTLISNVVNGDGVYAFGVTDASTVGKIEVQGAGGVLDFTGASLQIVLDNPSTMFVSGTNLLLAEDLGNNAILGFADGTMALDNSALLKFVLYRGDASEIGLTGDLLFAQIQLALLADIASHGDDPNAIALGAALDIIGLDGNAPLDNLMLDLALLGTDAEINAVLDSLLPETDGVAYDVATDAGDQILDVASRRLDGLRGTSVASLEYKVAGLGAAGLRGGLDRKGLEIWGQAFGRLVDQSRHDYNDGYDAGGYGFAAGLDSAFDGGKSLLGAMFAYSQTSADSNTVNRTQTDVDSTQLALYGDRLFDDRIYAKGMIGVGWHRNDIARHDVGGPLGPTVTAAYDAWQLTARAETGRVYKVEPNLTLVPHATVNYAYYDPDDYRETDPSPGDAIPAIGGLGLNVRTEALRSFRVGLGVFARWEIAIDTDALLQPELRLNYRRELIGDRFETTSEFIGAPGLASFRTLGVEPPADILNLGVGALLATAGGIDLRASYDLELKQDYTAHGGYVRASVPF